MCCETPDLANAAAAGEIVTPDGEDGVVAGHPTPVVIQKVHRVISIDDSIYENLETPLLDTLPDKIKLIKPVPFNSLAIAAPKLEKKETSPQPDTLRDLFNTFMAGFQLARDIVPNATIHTGPIGCGIFNNNRYVVWVLQTFAAHQVGVNLYFWSYTNS